jgi:uncharacterized oligopeptide transporter (OPT) family protein
VVVAQIAIFDIHWLIACIAVPIAFLLAMVASRVVGETGIPPIGAIGKVSQLATGVMAPGRMTENLMGANVAGGAAGQSADLLNDFKAGLAVQAPPRAQVLAQFFGILTGSLVGTWVYLQADPGPRHHADHGAMAGAGGGDLEGGGGDPRRWFRRNSRQRAAGGVARRRGGHRRRLGRAPPCTPRWLPSMPAVGLAMVIPASLAVIMFLGSLLALALTRFAPSLSQRFLIAAASGLIAGESLTGVGQALFGILGAG